MEPTYSTKVYVEEDDELRVEYQRPYEMLTDPEINGNALNWAQDSQKARTPANDSSGKGSSLVRGVDLRGLFSKLAPRLRRALIVVRTVRHRPIGDKVRARHDVRQVVQPTERILAAAEARYVAGAKLSDLAPELGVSRVRLAELLRRRGIRIRHVSPTRDEVKEMTRRYETGESLERIGTKLGFNSGTVRNYLLSSGVAMRDTHGRSHS